MNFPRIFRVRQTFERTRVADVPGEARRELEKLNLRERVRPGETVAITAGSRGIANIHLIIKAAVDFFKGLSAQPFIVAAMGSHGGGTPEGQRRILADYGITEDFCGCPVRCNMETVVLDRTAEGIPVHFARDAADANHVFVVNRVKPHTRLEGELQSGLMKMMLIGLGKHDGATVYHRAFADYSFDQIVRSVARRVMDKGRVLGGLGIVENAYDETALLRAVLPHELEEQEKQLLALARRWLPRLPFSHADILLVDEIGKEISGCGMDTNVIGRKALIHQAAPDETPKIKRVIVRGLTEQTHGNATGIGYAEFCLTRVVKAMDTRSTWINVTTSGYPAVGMIPPHYDTDREALEVALGTIGLVEAPRVKLLWIRNTLDVVEVECSEAYLEAARGRSDLEVLSEPRPLPFDAAGNLPQTVRQ
ncbi:MAG TPA: lactate racemase domain-containing protein [Verrucomicrobiae bacterium]